MRHKIICREHDVGRTPPVFYQLNQLWLELRTEFHDLLVTGACPLVDDLVVVCHREHILEIRAGEKFDHPVLCWRSVLKLVDQPVWMRLPDTRRHRRHVMSKSAGIQNHSVEIEDVSLA